MVRYDRLLKAVFEFRQRVQRRRATQPWQSRFRVEQLEPRILLSAEVLSQPIAPSQDQSHLPAPAIVEYLPADSPVTVNFDSQPIQPLVDEAVNQLSDLGFAADRLERARRVEINIVDLPGWTLAETSEDGIAIDFNADEFDWFIDPTPADSSEFVQQGNELRALAGNEADKRIDLLTVLTHELGHYLGLAHSDGSDAASAFMDSGIRPGIRRIASAESRGLSAEWNQPETRNSAPATLNTPSITEQLIETLRVANGPPLSEAITIIPTIFLGVGHRRRRK